LYNLKLQLEDGKREALFGTTFATNSIKERALQKHVLQFVQFLKTILYPKIRVSFGSNGKEVDFDVSNIA